LRALAAPGVRTRNTSRLDPCREQSRYTRETWHWLDGLAGRCHDQTAVPVRAAAVCGWSQALVRQDYVHASDTAHGDAQDFEDQNFSHSSVERRIMPCNYNYSYNYNSMDHAAAVFLLYNFQLSFPCGRLS